MNRRSRLSLLAVLLASQVPATEAVAAANQGSLGHVSRGEIRINASVATRLGVSKQSPQQVALQASRTEQQLCIWSTSPSRSFALFLEGDKSGTAPILISSSAEKPVLLVPGKPVEWTAGSPAPCLFVGKPTSAGNSAQNGPPGKVAPLLILSPE